MNIRLDPEWLCVLQKTNHLMHLGRVPYFGLGSGASEGTSFQASDEDLAHVREVFGGDLTVPDNFRPTAPTLEQRDRHKVAASPPVVVNPQTTLLCSMLDLKDPNAIHLGTNHHNNLPRTQHPWLRDGKNVSRSSLSGFSPSNQKTSTPLSSPGHPKLSQSLPTAAVTSPTVQRRNSLQLPAPSRPSTEQKNGRRSWGGPKTLLPSSLRTDNSQDELASILAAQRKRAAFGYENNQKREDDAGIFGSKSSADSFSQHSQDELDWSGYLGEVSQTSATDCMEMSLNGDSTCPGGLVHWVGKRPRPTDISAKSSAMKKLKRPSLFYL